jgi:methyltransferase family protein
MSIAALLQKTANDRDERSLSHRLRHRRFERFAELTRHLPRPLSIIDIGGTTEFWEARGWAGRDDVNVTLINLTGGEQRHENLVPVVGDATDLSEYADRAFDLAFSNSVIEHLFTLERQQAMAAEVSRVAAAYWIQTPNFWFPVEPHFLLPAWHWTPEQLRVEILSRSGVGWAGRCDSREHATQVVKEHRLMRRAELARLFPDGVLIAERFGGLVKSWTAVRGL